MVFWEITLATAYFLGLKRTYKLALRIQRKLISPKHPRIRGFLQRRTRNVFDMALRVHLKIQERDIEVGRSFGNWLLRWLDKMKPSAEIRGHPPGRNGPNGNTTNTPKKTNNSANQGGLPNHGDKTDNRHLFTTARNTWSEKPFSSITMMRPVKPAGSNIQNRPYATGTTDHFNLNHGKFGSGDVVRKDIRQYLLQH